MAALAYDAPAIVEVIRRRLRVVGPIFDAIVVADLGLYDNTPRALVLVAGGTRVAVWSVPFAIQPGYRVDAQAQDGRKDAPLVVVRTKYQLGPAASNLALPGIAVGVVGVRGGGGDSPLLRLDPGAIETTDQYPYTSPLALPMVLGL
jgi:hypothetical protein